MIFLPKLLQFYVDYVEDELYSFEVDVKSHLCTTDLHIAAVAKKLSMYRNPHAG